MADGQHPQPNYPKQPYPEQAPQYPQQAPAAPYPVYPAMPTAPPPYVTGPPGQVQPIPPPPPGHAPADNKPVTRDWAHGIFGCFENWQNCLLVFCCGCIADIIVGMRAKAPKMGITLVVISLLLNLIGRVQGIYVGIYYKDIAEAQKQGLTSTYVQEPVALEVLSSLSFVLLIAYVVTHVALRIHIRKTFNIQDPANKNQDLQDVICTICCTPCVICQEKSTVDQLYMMENNQAANDGIARA